ncbi:MAG: PDZ domain-containing protein, partial [Elusimicrobia bacterium]|nr:PDZ domain-containing protein [Elusimicrobiota bacterium]
VKVSAGGTLVVGEPVRDEAAPRRGRALLLEPDTRLRLEFDASATIFEPPQFYLAGPGLWIRSQDTDAGRRFEVTHVIPGRSAEKEGLRVGDILTAIDGRSSAKLEFEDALARLYGRPGSRLKVTVEKPSAKPRTLELKRGVVYKDGVETPVAPPFERRMESKAK